MGRELEWKYKANSRVHQALLAEFGPFQKIQMQTTYFDTPRGELSARRVTLRLRRENALTLCTLKTPLPDGSRGEWECPAETMAEGLARLEESGAPAQILALAREGLVPVCGARFTRLAARIPTSDGWAELALDSGVLTGSSRETPLCEVEIEHKSGSDQAAADLAQALADRFALVPEEKSKFRRAMDLAQGE